MLRTNIPYHPPETDSEDDYDGFYFGDSFKTKEQRAVLHVNEDRKLYNAVLEGDLETVKEEFERMTFLGVDENVRDNCTLLQHACREGHLPIVRWLLEEKQANANKHTDSTTPLLFACDCTTQEKRIVEQIALLLLRHDAVINVSDKYGTTPFMLACKNGLTNVVRHMIKDVSFDAVDNQGCTPIFHAIENNHPEIVRMLVDAGVNANIANRKGYTPVQVAQFHGFYDLLEILPKERESTYVVPSQFLGYNTLRDYIPRIFLKSECPEYFQEINSILLSINMEHFLEYFAKERISLLQFLALNDKQLEEVGIEYPIHRMKILKGLLDFHLHHWSKKSIARVSKSSNENFYEILMITANHMQHLVIITATLRYIKGHLQAGTLGPISMDHLQAMQRNLSFYRAAIKEVHQTVKYLASFSPAQNPLYIDYDEYVAECKRSKFKRYFKYTTIFIGISVFVCLKIRRVF